MKKKYSPYMLPPWLRKVRSTCIQFSIPICIFQAIRTIIFPTAFDILFFAALILLTAALHFEMI